VSIDFSIDTDWLVGFGFMEAVQSPEEFLIFLETMLEEEVLTYEEVAILIRDYNRR
jgi:hypothetical protein